MKLILTFPTGEVATIESGDEWQSTNPNVAKVLNSMNRTEGALEFLPHPYLEVAKQAAQEFGAQLDFEGHSERRPGAIY